MTTGLAVLFYALALSIPLIVAYQNPWQTQKAPSDKNEQ